jgi:serine/threonine protein kinase
VPLLLTRLYALLGISTRRRFLGSTPEQVNNEPVSPATDVWAMGVVIFRCLTGVLPFKAGSIAGLLCKIVNEPAPDLISMAPDVGPKFCAALDRAFAKEASRRYQDMKGFALALRLSARADGLVLRRDFGRVGSLDSRYRRNRKTLEETITRELTDDFP